MYLPPLDMARKKATAKAKAAQRETPSKSPFKSPVRSSPLSASPTPKKARGTKKKKEDDRLDRMEQQISALAALVTTHITGSASSSVSSSPVPFTPPTVRRQSKGKAFPPPPTAMADDPPVHDQITEAIKALDPSYKPTGGKSQPLIRPHLFIPRRHRLPKTSDQENVPFAHFVTGMAGMILSMMEDQASPAAAACRHLREAAEDTITRPWSVVREWSKSTFDRLALAEIRWDDYEEMQRERMMICFSAPAITPIVVPCPYFSAGNCQHKSCHDEGALALRHICPFCYASGAGRQDHPIFKCNSKKAYTSSVKSQFSKPFKQRQEEPPVSKN